MIKGLRGECADNSAKLETLLHERKFSGNVEDWTMNDLGKYKHEKSNIFIQ